MGDLTGDGVVVWNMLYLLSDFGCVTDCNADVDLDDAVTIADLLPLLRRVRRTLLTFAPWNPSGAS